jgi:hypothetical protein
LNVAARGRTLVACPRGPARRFALRLARPPHIARLLVAVAAVAGSAAASGCHALFIRPSFASESCVQSAGYTLRTDLVAEARGLLLRAAEEMRAQLDAAFPAAPGAPAAAPRELIVFASPEGFRSYLDAHFFNRGHAIGFYCELGGECALAWRDPPGPEDVRVLRHELAHQHLAARLPGRLPDWVEEGLVEALALDGAPAAPGWEDYRARRAAADAVFAALEVHAGARSWPGAEAAPATAVPPPAWAAGEDGYAMHLLFVRFLDEIGEGRGPAGALRRAIAAAARGDEAALDLSARFGSLGALESAFHGFVVEAGMRALFRDAADAARRP